MLETSQGPALVAMQWGSFWDTKKQYFRPPYGYKNIAEGQAVVDPTPYEVKAGTIQGQQRRSTVQGAMGTVEVGGALCLWPTGQNVGTYPTLYTVLR